MNFGILKTLALLLLPLSVYAGTGSPTLAPENIPNAIQAAVSDLSAAHVHCDTPVPVPALDRLKVLSNHPEIETVQDYADVVSDSLHKNSQEITDEIKAANAAGETFLTDLVGIGAGPQSAMAFSALKQQNPHIRTLIFEASHRAGVFDQMSGSFALNTTHNVFSGTPYHPTDFEDRSKKSFARAETVGNATAMTHHFAQSGVVFDQKVVEVVEMPEDSDWPGRYRITTAAGLVVYSNAIINSTGFGDPVARSSDPATQRLIERKRAEAEKQLQLGNYSYDPGIETVDHFLTRVSEQNRANDGTPKILSNLPQSILVVGGGHGGNIAIEALLIGALNASAHGKKPPQIFWAGQKSKTPAEFRSDQGYFQSRYGKIAPAIGSFIIPLSGKVESIRETVQADGHTTKLDATVSGTHGRPIDVDHIIFATGYVENIPPIFKLSTPLDNHSVKANISGYLKNPVSLHFAIGSQILSPEGPHDIWNIGAMGVREPGPIWAYATEGAGSITLLGPRSAAAGRWVAHNTPSFEHAPHRQWMRTDSARQSLFLRLPDETLHAEPTRSPEVFLLETKGVIGRLLNRFGFPADKEVQLEVRSGHSGYYSQVNRLYNWATGTAGPKKDALEFSAKGLSFESTEKLVREIQQEPGFISMLAPYLSGNQKFTLRFQTRGDGTVKLESSTFKLQ